MLTLNNEDGQVLEEKWLVNQFKSEEKAKGIRVAEWLIANKADVVLLLRTLAVGLEALLEGAHVHVEDRGLDFGAALFLGSSRTWRDEP